LHAGLYEADARVVFPLEARRKRDFVMAYLCLFVLLLMSAVSYRCGRRAAKRGGWTGRLVNAVAMIGVLVFALNRGYPEYEYRLLVWDGYIYFRGALFLPFAALFVGSFRRYMMPRSEQAMIGFLIFLSAVAAYDFRWGIGRADFSRLTGSLDEWGICRNSTPDTVGAAAGVTLLLSYGVRVTEGWMAEASLTRPFTGADAVGLCRALRLALGKSEARVAVERLSWQALLERPGPSLLIFRHRLPHEPVTSGESVAVSFGGDAAGLLIGSPENGLWPVDRETIERRWTGIAVVIDPPPYFKPDKDRLFWA
ncbi:MAG: hypothetical protein V1918_03915, partial [Planctomycetota bacterium]